METTTDTRTVLPRGDRASMRQLLIDSSELQLETWRRQLGRVASEAKSVSGGPRAVLEARIVQLQYKLAGARERLDELKLASLDCWDAAKARFQAIRSEI